MAATTPQRSAAAPAVRRPARPRPGKRLRTAGFHTGAIALSALLNLTVSLGRPGSARIDDREAAIFLAFDVLQLGVLLYLNWELTLIVAVLLPGMLLQPEATGLLVDKPGLHGADKAASSLSHAVQICLDMHHPAVS